MRLTVHLPDGPMSGTAFVSRSVESHAGGIRGAGFQFFALSMQSKQRWDQFIHQIAGGGTVALPAGHLGPPDRATFIIKLKDTARLLEFYDKNFTSGGLYIATPVLKETGAEVGLVIVHPDSEQEFMLVGRVERVCDAKPKGMEVCLQPMSLEARRQFRDFIRTGVGAEQSAAPEGWTRAPSVPVVSKRPDVPPDSTDIDIEYEAEPTSEDEVRVDAARPRFIDVDDFQAENDEDCLGDGADGGDGGDGGDDHDAVALEGVIDVGDLRYVEGEDGDEHDDDDDDVDDDELSYDIHLAPLGSAPDAENTAGRHTETNASKVDRDPTTPPQETQAPDEPASEDISIDIVEDEEAIRHSEKFGWDDVTGRGFVIDYALSEYDSQRAQSVPGAPAPLAANPQDLESIRLHVRVACHACGAEYGDLSLGPPRPPMGLFTRRVAYFCPRERILVGVLRLNHAGRRERLREELEAVTLDRTVTLRFAFDLVALSGAPRCPNCGGNTRRTSLAKAIDAATSELTQDGQADLPSIRCTHCGQRSLRALRENA